MEVDTAYPHPYSAMDVAGVVVYAKKEISGGHH